MRKQIERIAYSRWYTCPWSMENYPLPALPKWAYSRHLGDVQSIITKMESRH